MEIFIVDPNNVKLLNNQKKKIMPNWCATNFIVSGGEKELTRFANTVNELLEKESIVQNDFGRFWLANLAVALGLVEPDIKSINAFPGNLRGVIDPNGWAEACWVIGDPEKDNEPEQLSINVESLGDGRASIRFSTNSAWGVADWIIDYLSTHIPGCDIAYRATDDCGNFFIRTENWTKEVYSACGCALDCNEYFDAGQEKKFLELVLPYLNIDKTADELLAEPTWPQLVVDACSTYNDTHDQDIWCTIFLPKT